MKSSCLDDILAIDASMLEEVAEQERIRKEWCERELPEVELLETKYGMKLGFQLAQFLGVIRNRGIETAKAEQSKSTFYRLRRLLRDAGVEMPK